MVVSSGILEFSSLLVWGTYSVLVLNISNNNNTNTSNQNDVKFEAGKSNM